ncbi:MAG: cytochrome c-type biogenesis protein [Pseudomonadota bacterium]
MRFLLLLVFLLTPAPLLAVEPEEKLSDPALEARAREISQDLRCVVCQNQSIDDSDAQIASDMRKLVRERVLAGDSNEAVKDRMVEYYGEYVLLTPQLSLKNALIWGLPGILFLGGVGWYLRRISRGERVAAEPSTAAPPLSDEEQRRLNALLKD